MHNTEAEAHLARRTNACYRAESFLTSVPNRQTNSIFRLTAAPSKKLNSQTEICLVNRGKPKNASYESKKSYEFGILRHNAL